MNKSTARIFVYGLLLIAFLFRDYLMYIDAFAQLEIDYIFFLTAFGLSPLAEVIYFIFFYKPKKKKRVLYGSADINDMHLYMQLLQTHAIRSYYKQEKDTITQYERYFLFLKMRKNMMKLQG